MAELFGHAAKPNRGEPFVLRRESIIGSPVHALGLFGKRLVERSGAAISLPDFLRAARAA